MDMGFQQNREVLLISVNFEHQYNFVIIFNFPLPTIVTSKSISFFIWFNDFNKVI